MPSATTWPPCCGSTRPPPARIASRITSRFFPNDVLHPDLVQFAAAARGRPALADVLFYLTCRTEQIVALVAEQVVYPALAEGGVARTRIIDFVRGHFPGSRSVPEIAAAIVRTYFHSASFNLPELTGICNKGWGRIRAGPPGNLATAYAVRRTAS
jgi:hypothetical protein